MKYTVIINRKSIKNIDKMPIRIKELMAELIDDLTEKGAERFEWKNYSKSVSSGKAGGLISPIRALILASLKGIFICISLS